MYIKFEFISWYIRYICYACLEVVYSKVYIYGDDIAFFQTLNYKLHLFILKVLNLLFTKSIPFLLLSQFYSVIVLNCFIYIVLVSLWMCNVGLGCSFFFISSIILIVTFLMLSSISSVGYILDDLPNNFILFQWPVSIPSGCYFQYDMFDFIRFCC